jgi:hypothetical protein
MEAMIGRGLIVGGEGGLGMGGRGRGRERGVDKGWIWMWGRTEGMCLGRGMAAGRGGVSWGLGKLAGCLGRQGVEGQILRIQGLQGSRSRLKSPQMGEARRILAEIIMDLKKGQRSLT